MLQNIAAEGGGNSRHSSYNNKKTAMDIIKQRCNSHTYRARSSNPFFAYASSQKSQSHINARSIHEPTIQVNHNHKAPDTSTSTLYALHEKCFTIIPVYESWLSLACRRFENPHIRHHIWHAATPTNERTPRDCDGCCVIRAAYFQMLYAYAQARQAA